MKGHGLGTILAWPTLAGSATKSEQLFSLLDKLSIIERLRMEYLWLSMLAAENAARRHFIVCKREPHVSYCAITEDGRRGYRFVCYGLRFIVLDQMVGSTIMVCCVSVEVPTAIWRLNRIFEHPLSMKAYLVALASWRPRSRAPDPMWKGGKCMNAYLSVPKYSLCKVNDFYHLRTNDRDLRWEDCDFLYSEYRRFTAIDTGKSVNVLHGTH